MLDQGGHDLIWDRVALNIEFQFLKSRFDLNSLALARLDPVAVALGSPTRSYPIARLLGQFLQFHHFRLAQQLTGLKALLPGLDKGANTRIVENTKTTGSNPHDLKKEMGSVVSAMKASIK